MTTSCIPDRRKSPHNKHPRNLAEAARRDASALRLQLHDVRDTRVSHVLRPVLGGTDLAQEVPGAGGDRSAQGAGFAPSDNPKTRTAARSGCRPAVDRCLPDALKGKTSAFALSAGFGHPLPRGDQSSIGSLAAIVERARPEML